MKKLFSEKTEDLQEMYEKVNKRRKAIKIRTIFMVLLLLGVNIFAWFIYISKGNFRLAASIVTWDINFYNESAQVNDVSFVVDDIYPGMPQFEKVIRVSNQSDVNANLSYTITKYSIFGVDVLPRNLTESQKLDFVESAYPFSTTMSVDRTLILKQDSADFTINLDWAYESNEEYYEVTDIYEYDSSVPYYTYTNGIYVEDLSVNSTNFNEKKGTLFLEKDDADSFFGSKCFEYKNSTGQSCVSVGVELKVEQSLQ